MQHKVAVIGCGHWGKNLVRNFSDLGALGAVCDPDPVIATRMAEQHKVPAAGFEAICEDDEISGLVIAALARCMRRCLCRHSQRVSIFLLKNLWQ